MDKIDHIARPGQARRVGVARLDELNSKAVLGSRSLSRARTCEASSPPGGVAREAWDGALACRPDAGVVSKLH